MMTMLLLGTALAASAVVATWMSQQRDTDAALVAIGRDMFVPKNGDRGLISCFEIPGMPLMRNERAS